MHLNTGQLTVNIWGVIIHPVIESTVFTKNLHTDRDLNLTNTIIEFKARSLFMKSRKIFAVLFACAIAMLSLSACGGSNTDTTENSETGVVAETTDETLTENESTDSTADNESDEGGENDGENSAVFSGVYAPDTITDSQGSQMAYADYVAETARSQGFEEGTDDYNSFIASVETTYVFNEDGTVTATVGEDEKNGTYEFDGTSSLTTNFDGVITEYEYDAENNTLTAADPTTGITLVMSAA